MKKRALVAQLDRAVVSGTTSVGGSNPSERVSVKTIGKTSQMINLRGFFILSCFETVNECVSVMFGAGNQPRTFTDPLRESFLRLAFKAVQ